VVIGGGGHGLATAYYLARNHRVTNVAVLERGWLGGCNVGRNTTIVRANYLLKGNGEFYSHSLNIRTGSSTPSPGAATRCGCRATTPSC
jgi:sarcosine oxidase subunit beta